MKRSCIKEAINNKIISYSEVLLDFQLYILVPKEGMNLGFTLKLLHEKIKAELQNSYRKKVNGLYIRFYIFSLAW